MVADERPDVERGQHVAVERDERIVEPWDEPERAGGPQRRIFLDVRDRRLRIGAGVEDRANEVGEVAHAERDVEEPLILQLVDEDLEDRALPDRHERLREDGRVRREPGTAAACQDHGLADMAVRAVAVSVRLERAEEVARDLLVAPAVHAVVRRFHGVTAPRAPRGR